MDELHAGIEEMNRHQRTQTHGLERITRMSWTWGRPLHVLCTRLCSAIRYLHEAEEHNIGAAMAWEQDFLN
ncbi:hypothetical protein LguiB_028463 [Lonicera macranthoides]